MDERIDNGWDTFCSRTASAHLLRIAADLWEQAGAKFATGETVIHAEHRARALIERSKIGVEDEATFADVLESIARLDADATVAAVQLVKERARPLRGQLNLFTEIGGA